MKSSHDRNKALDAAHRLEEYFSACNAVTKFAVAGSVRRGAAVVGDLDIVLETDRPEAVRDYFLAFPAITQRLCAGSSKASAVLDCGLQVDVRFIGKAGFGPMLAHCTGPMEHNIALRALARVRGLKVSEYGVFRGDQCLSGADEESVYEALELAWIEPARRGNMIDTRYAHPTTHAPRDFASAQAR